MIDDDFMKPGPVWVICADGQFSPDVDPSIIERYAAPREDHLAHVKLRNVNPTFHGARDRITPGKATKPHSIARPVGRPRAKSHHVTSGRGQGWKRYDQVTVEQIHALQKSGLDANQIAARLNCVRATIYKRLRTFRRSPAGKDIDATLRTCPGCGMSKWATRPKCTWCAKGRNRPAGR